MSIVRCRRLAILVLCAVFPALSPLSRATVLANQIQMPADRPLPATYPQVVRISYLEGDVRVARGKVAGKPKGGTWETAVANLPLETGFSLVTEAGRAEIEFEDASTLYLDDNSVLLFNDVHSTGGIPYTEVALLAGTATVHFRPAAVGEAFTLKVPTDCITMTYPGEHDVRVSSYLDGMAFTWLHDTSMQLAATGTQTVPGGKTVFLSGNRLLPVQPFDGPSPFAAGMPGWRIASPCGPQRWIAS
jgi:hypothetical protein